MSFASRFSYLSPLSNKKNELKRLVDLASELGISQGEISHCLKRLRTAKLLHLERRSPLRSNALEFLTYGAKYLFPAQLGAVTRGIPTAHSAFPLKQKIQSDQNDTYVWPHAEGTTRGQSISPLYPTAPDTALDDEKFYQLLTLIDAIRIGRIREQELARTYLKEYFLSGGDSE